MLPRFFSPFLKEVFEMSERCDNSVCFPVRIEMGDDWYLVGLNVSRLDGLRVRM